MLARRFLNGLTLLVLCNMAFFDSTATDPVYQISKLLTFPAWVGLHPLEIFDQGEWRDAKYLLGPHIEGRITVTKNDVDDKVRQAYDFLSCRYASVFLIYQAYLHRLGRTCAGMDSSGVRDCLHKYWKLFNPDILVQRMQSALSFISSLSPQTVLINDVADLLTRFGEAWYELIGYHKGGEDCNEYNSKSVANSGQQVLHDLELRAINFFNNSCGPVSYLGEKIFGSSTYSWVYDILDEMNINKTGDVNEMHKIYTMVSNAINEFLILDYALLGFEFRQVYNTTVLNETPDSVNRANQTKELLGKTGWSSHLGHLSITVDEQMYNIKNLLAAKIDEHNVDRYILPVYKLMGCYFVEVLKELLFYSMSVLKFFYSTPDLNYRISIVQLFVQTVKKIDPAIVYMKAAVSYLQQLSPQTSDVYVSKILTFFQNSIEIIHFHNEDYYDSNLNEYNVETFLRKMNNFQKILSEIENEIEKYNLMFCIESAIDTNSVVLEKSPTGIEKQLVDKIDTLLKTVLPDLGLMKTV